jgi:uncharacterized membrane protein YeaQ/YmgE (transglycosylase-associated protein family)
MLDAATLNALAIVAIVGAVAGFIGGFLANADNLIGTLLMGAIGGISLSAIFRIANWEPFISVGTDEFSLVWAAVGGFVLGFAVGRSN